ncbi:heme exporter protein CcmB [Chloroflexota bacterium]
MIFWRKVMAVTWKDVLSEMRTKEIIFSVLVFTLLVIVIFNFAFSTSQDTLLLVAPGMLWVTFTFAGILSLNRSFVAEKEEGCLEGLMACPVSREAIYVGKMLGTLLFMLIVEATALLAFAIFFNLRVFSPELILVTVLSTIGFAAVGTLFSALAINTKARDLILPILFLPIVIPVIIGAVRASGLALSGASWSDAVPELRMVAAFDVVFLVVSFLVFTYVIEE